MNKYTRDKIGNKIISMVNHEPGWKSFIDQSERHSTKLCIIANRGQTITPDVVDIIEYNFKYYLPYNKIDKFMCKCHLSNFITIHTQIIVDGYRLRSLHRKIDTKNIPDAIIYSLKEQGLIYDWEYKINSITNYLDTDITYDIFIYRKYEKFIISENNEISENGMVYSASLISNAIILYKKVFENLERLCNYLLYS